MSINPEVMQQIRAELLSAPHGFKSELVKRRAEMYGVAPATIYRQLELNTRTRKGEPKRPELREWAQIVAMIKKRPPEEAGEISTDQAVRIGIESKNLPVAAMDVSVATFDRVMRDQGTTKKAIRAVRYQAKEPNRAHHFDGSTSNFFHIAGRMPNGEYILKMHRPAAGGYKNKPIPIDRLKPCYYGLVDDYSGRRIADVLPAHSENAQDSLMMLERFWREFGLSKKLLADQGLLKRCFATSRWIELVGVELPQMLPYAKRGHGKIENPWKTVWQRFEKTFYAVDDWQQYEITLTEFRRRLRNHIEEMNAKRHRYEKKITRMDAWRKVMLHGGITILPENSLAAAARETRRKVGIDGTFEYRGGHYEVRGSLCEAWVLVYEGIFTDVLVVKDEKTGERYEVKDFKPLDEGEFKNFEDTPHEKAVKAGAELTITDEALPYRTQKTEDRGQNVVRLPIRKTERAIENVFDVEHYASLEDAWAEIHETVGPRMWTETERAQVEQIIIEGKLTKEVVKELALELREAEEVQRARAL